MVKANAKDGKRASNRARTDAEEAVDDSQAELDDSCCAQHFRKTGG